MIPAGTIIVCKLLNRSWVMATISEKGNLTKKKSLTKLADVKDQGFITLGSWLKLTKSVLNPDELMEKMGCSSLYIHYAEAPNPDTKSVKAWEKIWWKEPNEYCLGCKKSCKQSSKVDILSCSQYVKV